MVTAPEAAALLAYAAEFDNRNASGEAVRAWSTILKDCDFQACREQIVTHYSREHRWIMPGDIKQGIETAQAVANIIVVDQLDQLEPPAWLTAMDDGPEFTAAWLGWRKEQARRIRAGEPLDVAEPAAITVSEDVVNAALAAFRESLSA